MMLLLVLLLTSLLAFVDGEKTIFDFEISDADGKAVPLAQFKDSKVALIGEREISRL